MEPLLVPKKEEQHEIELYVTMFSSPDTDPLPLPLKNTQVSTTPQSHIVEEPGKMMESEDFIQDE